MRLRAILAALLAAVLVSGSGAAAACAMVSGAGSAQCDSATVMHCAMCCSGRPMVQAVRHDPAKGAAACTETGSQGLESSHEAGRLAASAAWVGVAPAVAWIAVPAAPAELKGVRRPGFESPPLADLSPVSLHTTLRV